HPLVLARYLLPALPFFLLMAAEGFCAIAGRIRAVPLEAAGGGAVAALLLATGPIPTQWHYPNQFWGHLRYQLDYDPAHNPYARYMRDDPVPRFYRDLAKLAPGSV